MIVTIEGYNSKKNKSVRLASELAAFSAIKNGDKTLVIDLMNPDIDTAERMLAGIGMEETLQTEYQNNVSDDGIDSLLRQAETRMLNEEDFENYVRPIFLHLKHRLDVATITKNKSFTDLLKSEARFTALKRVILSAKDIYENIILILETKDKEACDMIKALDEVDKNIICLKQGFKKHEEITGKDIIYVCTDYNSMSKFNLKQIEREFISKSLLGKKSTPLLKISENIYAEDAAHAGTIIHFVARNKEANQEDINYEWIADQLTLLNLVFNNKQEEKKEQEYEKEVPAKRSFKLFGRKNAIRKIEDDDVEELGSVERDLDSIEAIEEVEEVSVLADIDDDSFDEDVEDVVIEEDILPPLNEPQKKKKHGFFGRKERKVEESVEEASQATLEEENARLMKEIEKLKANQTDVKTQATDAPKKKGPKPIKVEGVEYPSLRAACDHYDVGYHDVKAKLAAHMTISEAFGLTN